MNVEREAGDWSEQDWQSLHELRARYLADPEAEIQAFGSVWQTERELELYDQSFGRRIAWKWDAVLAELVGRGWQPAGGTLYDFGTGTGVAMRSLLGHFPRAFAQARLWDRSPMARAFARRAIAAEHPNLPVDELDPLHASEPIDLLLVSHVLAELDLAGASALRALLAQTRTLLIVEPGNRHASRTLGELREELRGEFLPLAPCPHAESCGVFGQNPSDAWCHFFARPPAQAFMERRWTLFSKRLHIDLRSLPYSYLLLERRARAGSAPSPTHARLLGRARLAKGRAELHLCSAQGVAALSLLERQDRAFFRSLREPLASTLVEVAHSGQRIISIAPLASPLRPPLTGPDR